jgi:hypothetical protein
LLKNKCGFQLIKTSSHTLLVNLDKNFDLEITNLGRYPIYINSIIIGSKMSDGFIEINSMKKVIMSGEITSALMKLDNKTKVFDQGQMKEIADNIASERVLNPNEKSTTNSSMSEIIHIMYRYGGTGSRVYSKEYQTRIQVHHPYVNAHGRMWHVVLEPISFRFHTNDWSYSKLPIEDA